MAFDAAELHRLQDEYIANRSVGLDRLYRALVQCGGTILSDYIGKIGYRMPRWQAQQTAHDAATRMLEQYIKHPAWSCRSFPARMRQEILYQLHNPQKRRNEQVESISARYFEVCLEVDGWDEREFVQRIGSAPGVDGMRIVIDLYRARHYKRAILDIAEYTPKSWIYEHAVELRTIYQHTRRDR